MPSSPQTSLANLVSCRPLHPMVKSWRRELWSSAEKDQIRDHLDMLNIDKFLGLGFQEC